MIALIRRVLRTFIQKKCRKCGNVYDEFQGAHGKCPACGTKNMRG